MDVRLRVRVGKNAGQELTIPGPKFFIGRAEDCQLRPRSDLISRHHCALLVEEGFVAVRDFGSKNGTQVNGQRVCGEQELKVGDILVIGPLEFEVVIGTVAPAKKRPKVESVKEAAARTAEGATENVDVSQWLTESDSKAGVEETRVIAMNETSEIDLGEGFLPAENLRTDDAASGVKKTQPLRPAEKKPPGKLPVAPKAAEGDSRQAAADVLSKFFKRR